MNTCRVEFRATTIKPKEFVGDVEKSIGAFKGGVYSMLNYLDNLGLEFNSQKLYKMSKPAEYLVEGESLNNAACDWGNFEIIKRLNKMGFHIKIERLSPNQRTGKYDN